MRLITMLLAASLAAGTIMAGPPPVEHYFKPGEIRSALLSPDGQHLAITTSIGSAGVSLVIMPTGASRHMRRVAELSGADIVGVHWVNNRRLVFSARDTDGGAARSGPGLLSVNLDGSDGRVLIQRISSNIVDGSRRDRALSSMHTLLQVPRMRQGKASDEVLVGEWGGDGLQQTLWLNVETGRTRRSGHRLPAGSSRVMTDRDGEPRVAIARRDKQLIAWWRGPGEAEWRRIAEGDTLNRLPFEPHTVDDAGTLYVTQRSGEAGEAVLSRFDFQTGKPEPEALVSSPGFDFSGSLLLEAETGKARGIRLLTDAEQTLLFDDNYKRRQALADARFPGLVNRVSCRRCGEPDELMLVQNFSDREPGGLWLYRAQPSEGEPPWLSLIRSRPELKRTEQASVAFERIRARDGRDLPLWLTLPHDFEQGKPRPTVVLVHGGPWVRGGVWAWRPMQQFLASRGYLVIEPEFRGSTGYGEKHFKAGWKQWGQAMQDDVADALLWAQKQGMASDRACIAGASYGGYSTLMGLVRHPELYRCGIAWVAVADLELLVKGSWWVDDDFGLARRHTVPEMIGDADQDAEMLVANSPLRQAARIKAPLLLAMGEQDRRVPLAHGKRLREAMSAAGNPPVWVVYEGEGHGWAQVKHQLDFASRVERFLAQHLATINP